MVVFFRYGFRSPPLLELKARPKLGEREVTLAHVTDWIEKKLEQEFQVKVHDLVGSNRADRVERRENGSGTA